jgi:DNA-binding Xre family transcriptional regulator
MIVVKLKEAMLAYGRRRGRKLGYAELAEMTGIPIDTLYSIGGRQNYYPTFPRIEKLCRALEVPLHDMLEMIDDPPKARRAARRKKGGA